MIFILYKINEIYIKNIRTDFENLVSFKYHLYKNLFRLTEKIQILIRGFYCSLLSPMPPFDIHNESANVSVRWKLWLERFQTFLVASHIKDDTRKRAMLLYQAGPQITKSFKTLSNTGEDKDYKAALEELNEYFEPQKNILHEAYLFHQARQEKNKTLAQFHVRLRSLAERCEFGDRTDFEIKLQIVTHCTSSRLPKKALPDPKYTLKDMSLDGQKLLTE